MSDEFAFAPTESQTAAMTAMKALAPGVHWHQVYNLLRSSYPDDFKDNDHDVYVVANHYAGVPGPPPAEPPAITALSPATVPAQWPAGADITVAISGTGFDAGPTVNVGVAHSLVPTSITPTDLSVLFSGTAHIAYPGVLAVSVTNADGQTSNALDFTVT
jgi:hypothetical protein